MAEPKSIDTSRQKDLPITPTTYSESDHGIDISRIDKNALYILEKLWSKGYTAYLVGGGVRDLLLDLTPKDFDISTSATPEETRACFRNCRLIGRRFRLAHVYFGKQIFEVSTFRKGDTKSHDLIVRDNDWGTPEEDVMRRDFTINGLFFDVKNNQIIDYVGGYADIQKRVLQTIGTAKARFFQDPVRMLRLIKFQARLGFSIEDDALRALFESKDQITKSSPARLLEEVLRMLESRHAASFFHLMSEYRMLAHLFPDLDASLQNSQESEKILGFLHHIDQSEKCYSRSSLMAALMWPLLQKRIESLEESPHLGLIAQITTDLIDSFASECVQLTRKLRLDARFILSTQYRLTPLTKRQGLMRPKILEHESIDGAFELLEMRAVFGGAAETVYSYWRGRERPRPRAPQRGRSRSRRRR